MGRERNNRLARRWARALDLEAPPKIFKRVFRKGTQSEKTKLAAQLRRDLDSVGGE